MPLNGMMKRVARILPRLTILLGLIGVLAGSAILVTCTAAGLGVKKGGKIDWSSTGLGFLEGLVGFLIVIILSAFFVGTIYLMVRTSEDVHAIRKKMESPPEAHDPRRE
jgi:hypothetical protein